MNTNRIGVQSLAALTACACAWAACAAPDTAQLLTRLEQQWSEAYLHHDTAAISAILAEDYIGIDGRGLLSTKQAEIEEAKAPIAQTEIPPFTIVGETIDDIRVRTYGKTAVLTGRSTETVRLRNGDTDVLRYRRTTVWVLQQGQWRCVSFHGSRILDTKPK